MAPRSLNDAVIATPHELDEIASTYGLFETAEATTMDFWVGMKKQNVLAQIQKTRKELARLEQSLARLESLTQMQFAKEESPLKFRKEYVAVEGWSLTLLANYMMIAGYGDEVVREKRFDRAKKYLVAAIAFARNHPAVGAQLQKPILDTLGDERLIFG